MKKVESLLCSAIQHANSHFKPGDDVSWLAIETPRGRGLAFQQLVEEAIGVADKPNATPENLNILSSQIFVRIFFEFRLIAKYFAGEFVLECSKFRKDFKDQFYQIWELFIEKWYFAHVYVGYGEDLVELDKAVIRKNKTQQNPYEYCNFRLYSKSGDRFYSIIAASLIESPIVNEERLVRCSLDEQTMFIFWWHILLESIGGINRALHALKVIPKQVVMKNFSDQQQESILESLQNHDSVFFKPANQEDIGESTFCEPMKFIDSNDVSNMFGLIYDYVERQASKLGYVFKPGNSKKERVNSGENFAMNKTVFNMQTVFLKNLNSCFYAMKRKWGNIVVPEDLTVVLSNQAWALGIPVAPGDEHEEGWLRNGKINPDNINNYKDAH